MARSFLHTFPAPGAAKRAAWMDARRCGYKMAEADRKSHRSTPVAGMVEITPEMIEELDEFLLSDQSPDGFLISRFRKKIHTTRFLHRPADDRNESHFGLAGRVWSHCH